MFYTIAHIYKTLHKGANGAIIIEWVDSTLTDCINLRHQPCGDTQKRKGKSPIWNCEFDTLVESALKVWCVQVYFEGSRKDKVINPLWACKGSDKCNVLMIRIV